MSNQYMVSLAPLWKKIVEYYYANIQVSDTSPSIWGWLEQNYNGVRHRSMDPVQDLFDLKFKTEAEVMFFKLRWS